MNVHVTVIESPVASDTSVNVCLASIPGESIVVLLNRPDSPMACVTGLVLVKVFANTIFVAEAAVPLLHVMSLEIDLVNQAVVDISFPSFTNASWAASVTVAPPTLSV